MITLPYSIADRGLTPKQVRDAFKRLTWEREKTLRLRVQYQGWDQETVDRYLRAKELLRSRTIADVATPSAWFLVCTFWNSKRMAHVREGFSTTNDHLADEYELNSSSKQALEVFTNAFVLHLNSEGSPLRRLRMMLGKTIKVGETPEQIEARERAEAHASTTNAGISKLVVTARREGSKVFFAAPILFGDVLVDKKEYVRIRYGEIVTTVKRVLLDEAAVVLTKMPLLTVYVEPNPLAVFSTNDKQGRLALRWSRGDGRFGGLNLHHLEDIHDSWCTVIEIPTLPNQLDARLRARMLANLGENHEDQGEYE